jgi:hypothetical protein
MTDKNQYQAFLRAKVAGAIYSARAAASLTHQGLKGTFLEILVGQLFKPLLPADIGVGTGQIIECHTGRLSHQTDIVLYDKSILPPILMDQSNGIFPVEAVLYAIEVKTKLTRADMIKAHESAQLLRSFQMLPGGTEFSMRPEAKQSIRSVVFALNTDLSEGGKSETDRYKEIYKDGPRYIAAICVAGREYSWEVNDAWIMSNGNGNFDETLNFIAGVTNTYRTVAQSRGYPALGSYIMSDISTVKISSVTDKPISVRFAEGKLFLNETALPNGEVAKLGVVHEVTSDERRGRGNLAKEIPAEALEAGAPIDDAQGGDAS